MTSPFITLSNFENRLAKDLLSRGHDYIDNVTGLKMTINDHYQLWRSIVQDDENYRVVIQAEDSTNVIRFNSCTCPFDESFCEHQVAVLYAIQMLGHEKQKRKTTDKVADLLSRLAPEEIKEYIRARAKEDAAFKRHFLAAFAVKTSKTAEEFKRTIEEVLRPLKKNHGFVGSRTFASAMKPVEYLVERARLCVDEGDYRTGINIYMATLEKLIPAFSKIDDSHGIMRTIVDDVFLMLNLIKEDDVPQSAISDVVKFAIKQSTSAKSTSFHYSWEFAGLAAGLASSDDEEEIRNMLGVLEREGKKYDFVAGYSAERAAYVLLHFFFNNKTKKEFDDFIDQNIKYYPIRRVAINVAMKEDNWDRVLLLCKDGIKEAQRDKHMRMVDEFRRMMLAAYTNQNDGPNIVKTAESLFMNTKGDIKTYHLLREHIDPGEWETKSALYKRKLERSREYKVLAEILIEENDPTELLRILALFNNVTVIENYASAVPKEMKPQLQKILFQKITKSLETRADRSNYRANAKFLKGMLRRYNDAATIAFVNELRDRYKLSEALIEEFAKIPTALRSV